MAYSKSDDKRLKEEAETSESAALQNLLRWAITANGFVSGFEQRDAPTARHNSQRGPRVHSNSTVVPPADIPKDLSRQILTALAARESGGGVLYKMNFGEMGPVTSRGDQAQQSGRMGS